jgi:cobalt-zinc-cadmium efflux system outer membrane protein
MKFILICVYLLTIRYLSAETYSLRQLLDIAEKNSAAIKAKDLEVKASDWAIRQSKLWPNPAVSTELGSITQGGNHGLSYSFSLSQPILFPGKLKLRTAALVYNRQLVRLSLAERKMLIQFNVLQAAYKYKILQEMLEHFKERLNRFKILRAAIANKPSVSPEIKAQKYIIENALKEGEKDYLDLRLQFEIVWHNLNAYLKGSGNISIDAPYFREIKLINQKDLWLRTLGNNPLVRNLKIQISRSKSSVDLLTREAYSDINISGYYNKDNGPFQERRFGLGVLIPLPLFNRNQHSVKEAASYTESLAKEHENTLVILQKDFDSAFAEYLIASKLIDKFPVAEIKNIDDRFDYFHGEFIKGRLSTLTFLEVESKSYNAHLAAFLGQETYVNALLRLLLLSGEKDFLKEF